MVTASALQSFSRDGLVFDVRDQGPPGGHVVILLHGFPATSAAWDAIVPGLTAEGYRVLAPNQRGYSPRARPRGRRAYRRKELIADVLALADEAGAERFHVVGHDWGAAVAWGLAMEHPQRLRTITALSVAHPAAFRRSMLTSSQALHSWYMGFFQIPGLADALMGARDLRPFEQRLRRDGVPPEYAQRYREHFAKLGSLTTAINWYRGMRPVADARPIVVSTPCLLIWGNRDPFLTRKSVDLTARYVSGPYRLDVLDGIGHWIPETAPDRVVELLLPHLRGA